MPIVAIHKTTPEIAERLTRYTSYYTNEIGPLIFAVYGYSVGGGEWERFPLCEFFDRSAPYIWMDQIDSDGFGDIPPNTIVWYQIIMPG